MLNKMCPIFSFLTHLKLWQSEEVTLLSTLQKHVVRKWTQDPEALRQALLPSPRCAKCLHSGKTWGQKNGHSEMLVVLLVKDFYLKEMPSSEIFFFTSLNSSSWSPESPRPFLLPASNCFFKYLEKGNMIEAQDCQIWEPPCGFHVHILCLFQFAEGQDPLKGVFSQTHVDVNLSFQMINHSWMLNIW